MIHYFDWTATSPLVIALSAWLYYGLAVLGGGSVVWQVCRGLVASGHAPASVARFALVFVAVGAPAAWLGYRAGALIPLPFEQWSWELVARAPRIGDEHSFHASVLLPLALLSALTLIWRYRYLEVMDRVFLFLPIAHATSRVGCLLVACCWGETVRVGAPGFQAAIVSPTPLYSIALNLLIFALLRKIFRATHCSAASRRRYEGTVFGGYLALYGASGLVTETFRPQDLVFWRLGAAELAMGVFVVAGACVLWRVRRRPDPCPPHPELDTEARRAMTRLTSILGIATSYLILVFAYYYLTRRTHILPTPFDGADSLGDAWARVLYGVPLIAPAVAALFFFRRAGERARPFLHWPGASPLFGVALLVSGLYALSVLVLQRSSTPGWAYWPPVLILSAVNAVSEELIHRLALLRLLLVSGVAAWGALAIQAALYSLVHFTISPTFGLLSLLYGLLLGVVMIRTRSLAACILCHFVIDLGAIGGPLLGG